MTAMVNMMHPDQRALLNGIIAEPDRDDLRLIYCDWLEEYEEGDVCPHCNGDGDEEHAVYCDGDYEIDVRDCSHCKGVGGTSNKFAKRAAFIRKQCGNPHNSIPAAKYGLTVIWRRGFIAEVRCSMAQWERHGAEVCSKHPVERVTIADKEPIDFTNAMRVLGIHPEQSPFHRRDGELLYLAIEVSESLPSVNYTLPFWMAGEINATPQFKTRETADDWLSCRCIETAKEKANQPAAPLPFTS